MMIKNIIMWYKLYNMSGCIRMENMLVCIKKVEKEPHKMILFPSFVARVQQRHHKHDMLAHCNI